MSPDKPDTFSNRMTDVDLSSGMSGLALGTPGGGVGEGAGSSFDVSVMTGAFIVAGRVGSDDWVRTERERQARRGFDDGKKLG